MILVDSSIWIDHLRHDLPLLDEILRTGRVLVHPYVIGEIALGSVPDREVYIQHLETFDQPVLATHEEAMDLLRRTRIHARGIGYVDLHLLASTLLTPGAAFWTIDRRLTAVAAEIGIKTVKDPRH